MKDRGYRLHLTGGQGKQCSYIFPAVFWNDEIFRCHVDLLRFFQGFLLTLLIRPYLLAGSTGGKLSIDYQEAQLLFR